MATETDILEEEEILCLTCKNCVLYFVMAGKPELFKCCYEERGRPEKRWVWGMPRLCTEYEKLKSLDKPKKPWWKIW